jgi:hypothetical protein
LAIQEPALAKKAIGKYTRTTDAETLEATYKENVKEYALRIPYVSVSGLRSMIDSAPKPLQKRRNSRWKKCTTTRCCKKFKRKRRNKGQP